MQKKVNRNIILSVLLLVAIAISVIRILNAAAPNPGHTWSEVGDVLVDLANQVTGVLGVDHGGNGAAPGATDQVLVSDSASAGTWRTLPSCSGNGKALRFNNSTNTFDCNMLQLYNQSVAQQGAGFNADTYLTGSSIAIPSTGMQAGTRYHLVFDVSKTAAGVATPIIYVRFGTNGSTADTARLTFTFLAQTAAADIGTFEVWVTFRTVGAAAVMQGTAQVRHRLQITGLQNLVSTTLQVTSGAFDSTVANSIIGVSVNGGAAASWTVQNVQVDLQNLN
jgi:hypothetical protein